MRRRPVGKAALWSTGAALAALLIANPVVAAERGHERDMRKDQRHVERHERVQVQHFDDHRRTVVREYYVKQYHGRRCPPGFVRHGNECGPSHYERKWVKGRPLPREVIYHTVPPKLVVELGAPPPGHKYVRVASDILLIAVGTGLVVDAITDLGR
jgi:Ni/Co efflux regulator RcnB